MGLDTIIKNQSDLIGDNQYEWQESPKILINATKETHLQTLPKDGFLIHVDRITSTNRQAPSVDQIKSDTPIDLVVDKDTHQICVKFTIHGRDEYRALRSCCCHIGGAQAGHYVNWSLDGRTITKVSDDDIEQTQIPENNQSHLDTIIKDISTSATLLLFGEAIMNFKAIDVKGGGAGCSVTNQDLLGGPKGSSNVISHSKGEQPKYDPKAAPSFKITGESYVIRPILNCVSAEVDLDSLKVSLGDEKYEQLKKVLSKLIKGHYICSHQADAVVNVVSSKFNNDTRGFILGDQPGVGKTRELISIALV